MPHCERHPKNRATERVLVKKVSNTLKSGKTVIEDRWKGVCKACARDLSGVQKVQDQFTKMLITAREEAMDAARSEIRSELKKAAVRGGGGDASEVKALRKGLKASEANTAKAIREAVKQAGAEFRRELKAQGGGNRRRK